MQKKERLKKICVSIVLTCCLMTMFFEKIVYKVEIDYPNVNVSMHQVSGEQILELDAKRAFENKVYANIERTGIHYDNLRIGFICNNGTEFYVQNIRMAVGNLVVSKVDEFEGENIVLHELFCEKTEDGGWHFITTGENPYIEVSDFRTTLRSNLEKYLLITFGLVFFFLYIFFSILLVVKKDRFPEGICLRKCAICKDNIIFWIVSIIVFGMFFSLGRQIQGRISEYMNPAEVLFLGMGALFVYLQLARRTKDVKTILACWLPIVLMMGFSVYKITTFLSVDEYQNIVDTYNINGENLRHWYNNCSRVNYLTMGTIWKLLPDKPENTNLLFEQFAKLLHWICGIGMFGLVAGTAEKRLVAFRNEKKRAISYAVLMLGMLSIPVVGMSLKNYNYDLFSMLLGVLGMIETIAYVKEKKSSDGIFAVVVLTLAMSEKLIVLPAWLLCLVVIVAEYAEKQKKAVAYVIGTGKVCFVVISTIWLSQKYVLDFLRASAPINTIGDTLTTLCEFPYLGVRAILQILRVELPYSWVLVISGVAMIAGILVCAVGYNWMKSKLIRVPIEKVNFVCGMGAILFLSVGVTASFLPKLNIEESRWEFLLFYIGNFVSAYPTIILLGLIISCVWVCKSKEKDYIGVVLCLNTFIIAIFYVIVKNTNFTHIRYANLYILSFFIIAFSLSIRELDEYLTFGKMQLLSLALVIGGIAVEIAGSQPAYSYFIPLWNQSRAMENEYGISLYWGEQWEIAGVKVKDYCDTHQINYDKVTLYIGYPGGRWLDSEGIISGDKKWMWKMPECSTTEYDFYVFETSALERGLIPAGMPEESIEPVITIKYRGQISARIYRGSDLKGYFGISNE